MNLVTALLFLPGLVIGITVHEFAHAFSASLLGDDYPRRMRRVSLNPLRHLSPLGTLAILFLPFGWGKPVPVNLYNYKRPKRDYLITSLAGPAANLVVVGLCLLLMQFTRHSYAFGAAWSLLIEILHGLLVVIAVINVMLATVNLIPIPPLDGSKIWPCLFPSLRASPGAKGTWLFIGVLVALLYTGSLDRVISVPIDTMFAVMPQSSMDRFNSLLEEGSDALEKEEYASADDLLSKAMAINPDSAEALYARGIVRLGLGEHEKALADLDRAIELDRLTAEYFEYRAEVLEALGRDEEASADREMAKSLRKVFDESPASQPDSAPDPVPLEAPTSTEGPGISLDEVVTFDFKNSFRLRGIFEFVSDISGNPVEVDWDSLEKAGVGPETKVVLDINGKMTLRDFIAKALSQVPAEPLLDYELTQDGVIVISASGAGVTAQASQPSGK